MTDPYYQCAACDRPFDPVRTRWYCPYPDCRFRNSCCEGEPA